MNDLPWSGASGGPVSATEARAVPVERVEYLGTVWEVDERDAWRSRRIADLRDRVARWSAAPGNGEGYRVTVPLPELRAALETLAAIRAIPTERGGDHAG